MALTQSGMFSQASIANAAGTLTAIEGYLTSFTLTRGNEQTDVTSFNAGGLPVTEQMIWGAITSEMTINGYFVPAYWNLMRQIVGNRSGVRFQAQTGANVAPTSGNEAFSGTYLNDGIVLTYNTGAVSTLNATICPVDSATLVPNFGVT